jgi:Delta3-Delta2-enoyl-CoA isomerase
MEFKNSNLVLITYKNQVCTLKMNMPKRFNGWTFPMMAALKDALKFAANDPKAKTVILTGTDPYYSAGVNLGGTLKLAPPRHLHKMIIEHNQTLFDVFIDFPKPILAAVNGPAMGAAATSATLCDGIITSEKASFSTPFAKLGVAREGCSSFLFSRLMGIENAERMLGKEGWIPTGKEAMEMNFAQWCVPHENLMDKAQEIAEDWIINERPRTYRSSTTQEELKAVNAKESVEVADSFLSSPFLKGQFKFLWSKKKRGPAMMFWTLNITRPVWSKFL